MVMLPTVHKANAPIAHRGNMRITFGKHKGQDVDFVLKYDPHWLVWAHENVEWFRLDEAVYAQAKTIDNVINERMARSRAIRDQIGDYERRPRRRPRFYNWDDTPDPDYERDAELGDLAGISMWGTDFYD